MNRAPSDPNGPPAPGGGERPSFPDLAADAIRYWEPRRLLYNAVLLTVVGAHFYAAWPGSKALLALDPLLGFFLMAVLANVAYCAAYAIDLFVQCSALRPAWGRWRWSVLAVGTAFAAVVAHFSTLGIMGERGVG